MPTGKFNDSLLRYFDATDGAFTSMTQAEIDKKTFNVKSIIRKLLVDKLTNLTLRALNSSDNLAKFKISDKVPGFASDTVELVCKYSKPNKDEMSIYFNEGKGIPNQYFVAGNIWFIYFKLGDPSPWLGIMSEAQFLSTKDSNSESMDFVVNEVETEDAERILEFTFDVNSAQFEKTAAPRETQTRAATPRARVISHKKLKTQEKNNEIRGKKGEEIALKVEKDRMAACGRADLVDKIIWVADTMDGLGYDIESFDFDIDGNEYRIFIEVKATSGGLSTPFIISENERRVSHEKGKCYYIYRIYDLDKNGENVKYYKVNGCVDAGFELEPVTYKAYAKGEL